MGHNLIIEIKNKVTLIISYSKHRITIVSNDCHMKDGSIIIVVDKCYSNILITTKDINYFIIR